MQVMPATSYLEEYRRKYHPIGTPSKSAQSSGCATDVHTLLQRYLGSEHSKLHKKDLSATSQIDESNNNLYPGGAGIEQEPEKLEIASKVSTTSANSDEDTFDDDDDLNNGLLLPTTAYNGKFRLTVDDIVKKDSQLGDIRNGKSARRHSNPSEGGNLIKQRPGIPRRCSSTISESDLHHREGVSIIAHSESDMSLSSLRRRDSNLSNKSLESSASNKSSRSFKGDIVEFSDEEFDEFDLEIDLNSSKQSDSDSQKLFSQFFIDSDSQKDIESLAGLDEVDGVTVTCANCRPLSARSQSSSDSTVSLCAKCVSSRTERQATIKEILESELSYYRDLKLIKQHYHDTLLNNGLLNPDDVSTMFGNIVRMIGVSKKFSDQLLNHIQLVSEDGDEYYNDVTIGRLICESSAMFLAFETYCLNYNAAIAMVEQLRKDNLLFGFFLDASLKDNTALRRIDLKTFLMLPVQRIMKYPLLLKRLYKATHHSHVDRKDIAKANEKLTNILHHINSQSKILTAMFSNSKESKSKKRTSFEIALTKIVLDTLNWKHDEIHFVRSGKVGFLQPGESQVADKLKTSRYNTAYAVVVTKGRDHLAKPLSKCRLLFPKATSVTSAALLVIKKGSSKLQVLGEPYHLSDCLISRNTEFYDVFEIQDNFKEPLIIRPVHSSDTWYRNLKYYSMVLGGRRHTRRNALPNILLHTL